MALPPIIEKAQRDWLFKVTRENSVLHKRDCCMLAYFLGTGLTTLEINRIQLQDVLQKNGKLKKEFDVRGTDRKMYFGNRNIRELTQDYIQWRVWEGIGKGQHPDQYLGLDPDDALFVSNLKKGFSIVRRETPTGNDSYTCDALNRHIKMLLKNAGIEEASILSGRRTFAVNLHRQGFDISHIHYLLGNRCMETTKKLLTCDPVDIGRIAATAF